VKSIIVVGHAALDRIYRIESFPAQPLKVRALEHIEAGGGMGANAAVAIARLGGPVDLWSRVGTDEVGAKIIRLLAEEGVNTSYVKPLPGRSATSAIIVDAKGERLIVSDRDRAMSMEAAWLPFEKIAEAGAVLSDLRWFEATGKAFRLAREAGIPTVIDADLGGGDQLLEFLPLSDYAIFSAPEIDRYLPDMADEERLARVLDLGVRHAGVTRGAKGYVWRNRRGEAGHQPAFPVEVVDTTGAGDAFHGAFTWALAQGMTDAACARAASGVAAMKCRRIGARAGLPTRAELEAFLHAAGAPGL
jgi:sulfofructose kinase